MLLNALEARGNARPFVALLKSIQLWCREVSVPLPLEYSLEKYEESGVDLVLETVLFYYLAAVEVLCDDEMTSVVVFKDAKSIIAACTERLRVKHPETSTEDVRRFFILQGHAILFDAAEKEKKENAVNSNSV